MRAADTPLVFHSSLPRGEGETDLVFAATLTERLRPDTLHMCPASGRLYHPIQRKHMSGLALVAAHLALEFAQHFVDDAGGSVGEGGSAGELPLLDWHGRLYQVRRVGADGSFRLA